MLFNCLRMNFFSRLFMLCSVLEAPHAEALACRPETTDSSRSSGLFIPLAARTLPLAFVVAC